ncbi:MAG: cobalamin-binding protein [Dehalococcoidia bacterium]|nr:cobalamin-binding protein [Dehalococcoidia bacterium]
MSKHRRILGNGVGGFVVLVVVGFVLVGCSPSEPTSAGAFVDDLGRPVSIEEVPQTIVSLAPSNTEILFALGLGDKVVGVTKHCDYPQEASEKEKIGGYSTPDLEKIVALQPDLILASSIHEKEVIPSLEEMGFTVFALEPRNLAGIMEGMRVIGVITGSEGKAGEAIAGMEGRVGAITDETENLETLPGVLYITWHDPLWSVGSGNIIHELIDKAGGMNIFQDITGHKVVSLEAVILRNPDVIIACSGHGEAKDKPFQWVREESRLGVIEARKNNRIYEVDADLVNRAGPRAVDALEWFAYFIHPELFDKP